MIRTTFVPISIEDCMFKTKDIIMDNIYHIEEMGKVKFLSQLCRPSSSGEYFILTYDIDFDLPGSLCPNLGVSILETSVDINLTEKIINKELYRLSCMDGTSFVNIFHPYEFMYIILFECNKKGEFPKIKFAPLSNYSSSLYGQTLIDNKITEIIDEYNKIPFDCKCIDNNHIMYLF